MANPWILDPNQQLQLINKPEANRGQLSWAHAKKFLHYWLILKISYTNQQIFWLILKFLHYGCDIYVWMGSLFQRTLIQANVQSIFVQKVRIYHL